ncbi:protein phosphatase 2A regulatory subunit cdc55 [Malassezia yamatoensis]|uniref:Protein phosphatase PP2A regulatory subunit B n=1 Tax=Malassezia yamatoensis TaxID=253288 RepID=A0AAJ5YQM7_9BASI|nr:protein phosphatase 2A regulatory subunit cdc55 [Malassezia yamatoensis]
MERDGANAASPGNTWRFAQCFGDKGDVDDITEADIISTVEFDPTGNYLATGDKGGRVVMFERSSTSSGKKNNCEYRFHTEFQSHEPEFDYLKSLEIEEKINQISWCRRQNAAHLLLSTNDKTIKLWKVFDKPLNAVTEGSLVTGEDPSAMLMSSQTMSTEKSNGSLHPSLLKLGASGGSTSSPTLSAAQSRLLRLPRLAYHDTIIAAVPRKIYANAHAYHINSLSVNSDGETYISADDLRINLWNLGISDKSFNIVDIKPVNMEELTEVITAAQFHPTHCNELVYSSSKGTIKLADMRESALCDRHAKLFEEEEDPASKSFFSEIISSISNVRFSHDGRYLLSRDYLTLKVWDVNMESRPVATIPIHDYLRPKLCDLYENDCIFDKFEGNWGPSGSTVLTGGYSNYFHLIDWERDSSVVLQADKSAFKSKKSAAANKANGRTPASAGGVGTVDPNNIDFNKKILHTSYHPREDTIAIAATNNLFIFSANNPAGMPA